MRKLLTTGLMIGVGFALSAGISAHAAVFTFSYDTLAAGQGASTIQTYMDGILGSAGSVAVSGTGGGVITDQTYAGDGHVVGPTCTGTGASQGTCGVTLGDNAGNGTYDTYLKTNGSGTTPAAFTFTFTLPNITIDSVTFDYEIFPDASCTKLDGTHCGGAGNPSTPNFTFTTNLNTTGFTDYGVTPGIGSHGSVADVNGNTCASNGSGTGTHPCTEQGPQKLVLAYTPTMTGVAGATSFTFSDWPATIGIDNFVVTYHTNTVPEPTSIVLLATVTFLVGRQVRRKMRTNA